MLQNYNQLIDKIARASGLTMEEVDRKVEAKCAKLSGLISKEGSAQIVASELGINFDKEKMKIDELMTGMKKVNLVGKVITEPVIREFNKNGREGKVLSTTLGDDTNNIRVVLWDTNHIALFEDKKLNLNDVIEISNAAVRNDELHLSGFSDIKKSQEVFDKIISEKKLAEKNIIDLNVGMNVRVRANIVQVFEPRFFEVCPQCSKKAINNECGEHGSIIPEKRALISLVLDDGTESIRGVLFNEQIKNLGISDEELNAPELFAKKKNEILGDESYFLVNVRDNKLFNSKEVTINGIEKLELDSLIESLRK
jgi:hypothetical protein